MEAERNGTMQMPGAAAPGTPVHGVVGVRPDPETPAKAQRRRFDVDYKLKVLQEADACGPGGVGALLRREGLYSSQLTDWRRQRAAGQAAGLRPKRRGRGEPNPASARIAQLEREVRRLTAELERANLVIEVQGKVSRLLGIPPRSLEHGGKR